MPSYSSDVKNELAHKFYENQECSRAEIIALLNIGALNFDRRKEFMNSNAATARKVITLTKKVFPNARTEIAAVRTKKLRKSMKYFVRVFFTKDEEIFFKSPELHRREEKIAYLRGAFLAGGTVNRPESYYRLEIISMEKEQADFLKKILRKLSFNPNYYQRGEEFVVYLCDGESVCDFLGMIGADVAVERFESARNLKEIRAQVNRLMNCEMSNLNKAIETAQRQLNDIRILRKNKIEVSEILEEAMTIREKNPSCSVAELAEKIFITREALMHRFKKIHLLAENLTEKISDDKIFPTGSRGSRG